MYFEAIITKKYVKQQLKNLERKLRIRTDSKNIVKSTLSSIPKEPSPDVDISEKETSLTEKYKKYLIDHDIKYFNDIPNLRGLAREICTNLFPDLKGTSKNKKVDSIRHVLSKIKENLPTSADL